MTSTTKRPVVKTLARAIEPLEQRTLMAIAVNVGINTTQTFQTIEGMGAAMIPWDQRPEYNDPAFFDRIVNDLGASSARASLLPLAETTNDDADPNHFNWAAFNKDALAAPFDFFQQLKARGVTQFLGTAWTAPNWMKTNQLYTDGGSLRPDMYAEYAEYMSAVTQIAKNDYGVDLSAISIQNEPYFVEPYESTTYNANQLRETLRAVGRKFAADGVDTKLILPEDLIFEDRMAWYAKAVMTDPETKNYVDAFGGHGLTTHWDAVRDALAPYGKEFWMTETSGTSATWPGAMGLANSIMNAIGTANASVYDYWQFSDSAANSKFALMTDGQPNTKYYAAKQFYRYIRPGYVHVGATSSYDQLRVNSFKDPKTGAMTTVILNTDGDATDVNFALTGSSLPGTYKVFRSSSTENMVSLGTVTGGSNFSMTIPGLSLVTITSAPELAVKTGGAVPVDAPIFKTTKFYGSNNFFEASLKGYNDSLASQITAGANVNQVASNGWTPLILAASSPHAGSINTLNTLLSNGASISAVTNDGWTALHAAAANTFIKFGGPVDLVSQKINALINAGINVNAKDNAGRTPLMWAAMMGAITNTTQDPSIVKTLLSRGADPFAKDNSGKTALDYANAQGYERIADALIAAMGTDHTKPTADVVDVSPDPRTTSVTDFLINFSERTTGFDLTDITLTRNGVAQALPLSAALATSDDIHFQLSGMGGATAATGAYVITVKAAGSGIVDPSNNPLAGDAADAWTNGDGPPPTDQTPFKGTPFVISQSGAATIELEDYDKGGEGIAYHDTDTKNNGGSYRTTEGVDIQPTTDAGAGFNIGYTKAGEWSEYTINVTDSGSYDLQFRAAAASAGGKFHAEIDGVNVTGALIVPNTGGFQTWQTVTKSGVTLSAGQHVLRFALDTAGSNGSVGNFNWIKIGPAGTQPPPDTQTPFKGTPYAINTSGATTIEFEDFDNGGEGVAYHDIEKSNLGGAYRTGEGVDIQPSTDAGGGFNLGYTKAGEWLEYTINVATSGNYDFAFRLASTGSNGKIHAEIDGANVTGSLTVPSTGGYQNWQTLTKSGVALAAGQHVLRVALDTNSSNGSIGNMNWLKISPAGTTPTQSPFLGSPFQVGASPVTIQTEDFDNGGEGTAYHDVDSTNSGASTYRSATAPGVDIDPSPDTGGGILIAYTKAGEWLEYSINVATAGTYNLDFRIASQGLGGKFHAEIDGADKTGQLQVPDTTNWGAFQTVTKTGVSLTAGQHVLRLAFDTAGGTGFTGNFNWIKISPAASTPATTISTTTSTYVRGGTSANTNFGTESQLVLKKHTDLSSSREAYVTFDLSSVASINSAKLRLFGALNDTSSTSVQTQIFAAANTTWNELSMTWATRPGSTGSALGTITVAGTAQKWYEVDLTSYLKSEKALGHNIVSLALKNPTQQNALVVFNSDDASSNQPELSIT